MIRTLLLLLLLVPPSSAQTAPEGKQDDDLLTQVRRYLKEPGSRKAMENKIATRSIEEIERAIRSAKSYETGDSGVFDLEAPNAFDPKVMVKFKVYVPELRCENA